jgi:hypothetical protein
MSRHLLVILAALAMPAAAQDLPGELSAADDIPVDEWAEMAMGRTLTYRIDGELWAFERYHRGGNRVTLQLYDGTCMEGTWDYRPPYYCFHWNITGTACFRHARLANEILIIEDSAGDGPPPVQKMTSVSDLPLQCGPAVTS